MKKFLAAALTIILTTPAMPQDQAASEVEARLKNMKVSFDFKSATLDTIVDYIRELGAFNILVDKSTRDKGEILISLSVKDISLRSALNLMLKSHGLTTMFKEGVLLIVSKETADEVVFTEIYDVRDLLFPIHDMPGIDIAIAGITAIATPDPPTDEATLPIEELVRAHTGKKTWDTNPRASVKLDNGLLVVRQTKDVHKEVRRLLGKLREMK